MPVDASSSSGGNCEALISQCVEKVEKLTDELGAQKKLTEDLRYRVEELERHGGQGATAMATASEASGVYFSEGNMVSLPSKLLSAFYHDVDVTEKVSGMLVESGGTLVFNGRANNTLGDPARGVRKVLCLTWLDKTGNCKRQALGEVQLDKGLPVELW